MSDVRCPMSDVRCSMFDVRCPRSLERLQRHLEEAPAARAFFFCGRRLRLVRTSRPRVEPALVSDAVAVRVGPVAREEAEPDRGEPIAVNRSRALSNSSGWLRPS